MTLSFRNGIQLFVFCLFCFCQAHHCGAVYSETFIHRYNIPLAHAFHTSLYDFVLFFVLFCSHMYILHYASSPFVFKLFTVKHFGAWADFQISWEPGFTCSYIWVQDAGDVEKMTNMWLNKTYLYRMSCTVVQFYYHVNILEVSPTLIPSCSGKYAKWQKTSQGSLLKMAALTLRKFK